MVFDLTTLPLRIAASATRLGFEIIARLDGATREEVADVALYEELRRQRRTVVIEARRQLQQATATAARHA